MAEVNMSSPIEVSRYYGKKMAEWKEASGLVPFCRACARLDLTAGTLKELTFYQQGIKEGKVSEHMEEDRRNAKYGLIVSVSRNYQCPRGHGIGVEWSGKNYEAYLAEAAKKK